jgi:hypothetical protein
MATETVENGRCTMQWEGHSFFSLGIGKGGDGGNSDNGCNDDNDNDGKDDGNDGKLWQQRLLPPLFVRCQNFGKRCQTFGRTLFAHNFGSTFQHMRDRTCLFYCIFGQISLGQERMSHVPSQMDQN